MNFNAVAAGSINLKAEMMAQTKQKEAPSTPQVGILFFVGNRLWIETTPLESAGTYGEFKIHENDHVVYWDQLILAGVVPRSCCPA
jgi:hypothetical protein